MRQSALPGDGLDALPQGLLPNGLDQVARRFGAHRAEAQFRIRVGGHEDDGNASEEAYPFGSVYAVDEAAQIDVHHDEGRRQTRYGFHDGVPAGDDADYRAAYPFQAFFQFQGRAGVGFGDESPQSISM